MTKTPVTYKETLQGILEIHEIERIIMDNLVKVQKYLFRNYKKLPIGEETAQKFHKILAGNLFEEAGRYRKHDVELGIFQPPHYFQVRAHMRNWEADYQERKRHTETKSEHVDLCAWIMHRFLWIHPFFDYNGRMSRLLGELYLLQNHFRIIPFQAVARIDFVKAVKHATETDDFSLLCRMIKGQIE